MKHLDLGKISNTSKTEALHVFYDLENKFRTLKDAEEFMVSLRYIDPVKPLTADNNESPQPRVCVARTLEDCFSGIVPDVRFRRCVANGNTKFDNEDECYPIIIARVLGDFFTPTFSQVYDVEETNELWAIERVDVLGAKMVWLGHDSVVIEDNVGLPHAICTSVKYEECPFGHHPWVDGKGHPLECSDTGKAWPPDYLLQQHIWFESYFGHKTVFVVPEIPANGFCTCYPIDGSQPYRGRLQNCKRFTGYFDQDSVPLFEGDMVLAGNLVSSLRFDKGVWYIMHRQVRHILNDLSKIKCLERGERSLKFGR